MARNVGGSTLSSFRIDVQLLINFPRGFQLNDNEKSLDGSQPGKYDFNTCVLKTFIIMSTLKWHLSFLSSDANFYPCS